MSAHISSAAPVVTNMILWCYVGMSERFTFGLAADRTSFGSLAGCIVPIVSKCFAFGLAAYRAGLGSVAGRIVPIVSECVSVGLTADGAVCGVAAVSSSTDTLVVNRQAAFITFAVKGIGIIYSSSKVIRRMARYRT